MPLTPVDWNVIVVGRWNRALLTPQFIVTELFKQPPGTDVEIEVPMDAVGPFRVLFDGLVVVVTGPQLIIEAPKNDLPSLQQARVIAQRAMEELPRTPLNVAGYNIRYRSSERDERLKPLIDSTQLWGRERFAKAGYDITRQVVTWVAGWAGGKISVNVTREQDDSVVGVNFNFERGGNRADLVAWLDRPIDEAREQVEKIWTEVLGLPLEAKG